MSNAPKWLTPVAIVGLLWNLLGCFAWVMDMRLTPEQVAAMGAEMQQLYASRPLWAVSATGVAVLGGAVGCIGLLLRKRWASKLLWLSLVGVIAQDIGLFVLADGATLAGPGAVAMQGVVLVISIALALLGRHGVRAGWLR
ncbi:hypothetical protein QAA18_10455 [Luteimonas sp. 8-5]|uniref:hypothetical protein n=1 Tax=Luteimonas sp. 8-5 TaxID=3039387 RepID=UPI0024368E35|nr:hypothetical protein [Luteimonas sp. 8-5]MDG6349152.1 hypothetical protein [Luteimonas sp. 8-5]